MLAHRDFDIPFIPALVDIDDVIAAGGRLIPENDVPHIIGIISLLNENRDGRYTKKDINKNLKFNRVPCTTKYSVMKIGDQYYAIYKGRKHKKLLGEGTFGAVKFVQNIQDGSWAVIKIVPRKNPNISNQTAITREKNNLAKINHLLGHVHRLSEKSGLQDEIIMVLAPGTTVKSIIKHRKMAAVKLLDLSRGIAEAIAHTHAEGLYHRDIKPDNMLYDPTTGVVTLIDFGLARAFDPNTKLLQCSRGGSPKYSAPEISNLDKNAVYTYTEKTEVYAFGITLLDIYGLSFNGREIEASYDFLSMIRNVELRRSLITLLNAMISQNPEQRPDMQSVCATLAHLRANELDLYSKINTIAYVDVNDFVNTSSAQKEAVISALKSADEVHLCAFRTPATEVACMRIKHALESNGVVVAARVVELDANQQLESIAQSLKTHAEHKARENNVIYNAFYVQASKLGEVAGSLQIQRSINRVDMTEHHKVITLINIQRQIERLNEKNSLDVRLQFLRKFKYAMEHGYIKTYQQLFAALSSLEQNLLDTPNQSKIGSFAKHHGLYSSTSASVVRQTIEEISNDAYGIRKSTTGKL